MGTGKVITSDEQKLEPVDRIAKRLWAFACRKLAVIAAASDLKHRQGCALSDPGPSGINPHRLEALGRLLRRARTQVNRAIEVRGLAARRRH
jgi:hypothetical protein